MYEAIQYFDNKGISMNGRPNIDQNIPSYYVTPLLNGSLDHPVSPVTYSLSSYAFNGSNLLICGCRMDFGQVRCSKSRTSTRKLENGLAGNKARQAQLDEELDSPSP